VLLVASPTQVSSAWAGAAAGPRDVSQGDLVTTDTLFRIMSMTKMPCTVAALQQVEQGNLDLDAPVASYCPEFAEIQVLTGFDGDTPVLRPPARQDGTWTSIGEVLNQEPDYWAGGHGLYGPPSDYIKFQRALLRGGELDGTSILRQSTVDEAFRNQIGGLDFPPRFPAPTPPPPANSTWAPASSGATGCCSTPRISPACDEPGPAPGPGCATPTSGSTAAPACAAPSTATSCRS
jgi:CubicO group peptidase (beta-lactamase class C family)